MKIKLTLLQAILGLSLAWTVPPAQAATPKKVLVVSTTTGFRHSSIATGEKVLAELGRESGAFTVELVQQPIHQPSPVNKPKNPTPEQEQAFKEAQAKFATAQAAWQEELKKTLAKLSPDSLKKFDAVVFLNTTGDLPLPDKEGFLNWVKAGHGFVGIHSASDTFHGFRPYLDMLGGEFKTHGAQVGVECLNEDHKHPATAHLSSSWPIKMEEIYLFNGFKRDTVHSLLSLDKHPNDKTPGYYPVSWCKNFGSGKVFYTSLGHREDVIESANYKNHVLGGIQWALGLAQGDATPQQPATK